jgi:hypothetical protein
MMVIKYRNSYIIVNDDGLYLRDVTRNHTSWTADHTYAIKFVSEAHAEETIRSLNPSLWPALWFVIGAFIATGAWWLWK